MVLVISVIIAVSFIVLGFLSPEGLLNASNKLFALVLDKLGWLYLVLIFGILLFSLWFAFSKYGKIRLGRDDEKPEHSLISWFAMLFSAGMGIGLVFWGVAEPVYHYSSPPMGIEGKSAEAAFRAVQYSFFHWGLHPWAIYCIFGLAFAYFSFRRNKPFLISSSFTDFKGMENKTLLLKIFDIMSIVLTVFGVASSLGLGTLQINRGINYLFGVPMEFSAQVWIVLVVTILFVGSSVSGVNKGIKILSDINITLMLGVLLFLFVAGPGPFILKTFVAGLSGYFDQIIPMSLNLDPFLSDPWVGSWTLFYWAWWLSWGPFVGSFIARVSRGRTIKEFVLGVVLVPAIFCFVWFAVLGGTALHMDFVQGIDITSAVANDVTTAVFVVLEQLPFSGVVSVVIIILLVTFFITSADSATFVLAMLSSDGNQNPKNRIKLMWGALVSLTALILILSGGLQAIQNLSIIIGVPFLFMIIFLCIALVKGLRSEGSNRNKQTQNREDVSDEL